MPANNNPIYSATPIATGSVFGQTANVNSQGSGTIGISMMPIFIAGASGSYVQRARFLAVGSAAATATAPTVLRIFIANLPSYVIGQTVSSGSAFLFQEVASAAITTDQTTTGTPYIEIPLNFGMQSGSSLLATSHVINNANTAWAATVFGGNY